MRRLRKIYRIVALICVISLCYVAFYTTAVLPTGVHQGTYDFAAPRQFLADSVERAMLNGVEFQRPALPPSKNILEQEQDGAPPTNLTIKATSAKLAPAEPPELPNDWTFTEDDMVDETGKQYTILIWGKNHGVPGYRADPEVCLGNVSCKLTYFYKEKDDSHAIVYRHNVGIGSSGIGR